MYFNCFKEVPGQTYHVFHIHTKRYPLKMLFLNVFKNAFETDSSLF